MFRSIQEDSPERFHIFPLLNRSTWALYEDALACVWTPNDLTWADDRRDFETLTSEEQRLLKHTMAFFAFADHVVADAVGDFDIPVMEVKFFHDLQVMMENVHHTVYAQSIKEIIPDELDSMLQMVRTHPSLLDKRRFLEDIHVDDVRMRLLIWACMEGIAFAGTFAVVFYFKSKNKMMGLAAANQYIARDETLHKNFAVHLLNDLKDPLPSETVFTCVRQFVEQEKKYYSTVECDFDLNAYVEFVGNSLLVDLGEDPIYDTTTCPLDFMNKMSMRHEANFFEVLPTAYEEAGGEIDW